MIFTQCRIIQCEKWSVTDEKQHSGHMRKSTQLFIPRVNVAMEIRTCLKKLRNKKSTMKNKELTGLNCSLYSR